MADLADQITGMSKAFDQYIQGGVQNQQETQLAQNKSNIETNQAETLSKFKQNQEGTISPEMGRKLFSTISPAFGEAAFQSLSDYEKQNGHPMTPKQATDFLDPVMKGIAAKNAKSNIKHYLGNDPDGNAIFSDNNGNMTSPDGSVYTGKVLPKSSNAPTASTKSSAEFATTILPHITEMRNLIKEADAKGFIGPGAGRVYNQFMAGKVGSTGDDDADRLLGKLRSMDSLLKTGAMRVHFGARGGASMYDHFSDMLNTGKQSSALLNGSLDTMEEFMRGYADAGRPGASQSSQENPEAIKARVKAKLGL